MAAETKKQEEPETENVASEPEYVGEAQVVVVAVVARAVGAEPARF